jgi:hypothetical protein
MYRFRQLSIVACIIVFAFSSCNKIPDHAKYIPKDAVVVAGVNIKALTKKVAWSAITGSKLFQDIQKHLQGEKGGQNFENTGIDVVNTMYVYVKADARFRNGRVVAIIPLSDAKKWENFIKSNVPGSNIEQHDKIRTVDMKTDMFAGWNDKVLILLNTLPNYEDEVLADTGNAAPGVPVNTAMAKAELDAEMNNAFNVTTGNALINNQHFVSLERADHDVIFWMNYDQLMNQYLGQGMAGMLNGLSMANAFWKDAALAAGFDFEKGRITGDMHYYTSTEMKDLGKELGGTNADREMIDKMPANDLDLLFTYHLSPKGARAIFEKMGVLGFMNLALTQQNLDVDYVMDAFTGDMALSLNDLTIKKTDTLFNIPKPKVSYLLAMKINKAENFKKLLGIAQENGLQPAGNGVYTFSLGFDTVFMATDNKYIAIANNEAQAKGYIEKGGSQIAEAKEVYGHPIGFYMNMKQILGSIDMNLFSSEPNAGKGFENARQLFENMYINGGEYREDGFDYKFALNFINKDENSLLQLMDFAVKVNELNNSQ